PRRRLAGLTAFCTLALLLVWPFTEAGRFLVPLVPALLVGATEGLAALRLARPRAVAAWLVLALTLPYPPYAPFPHPPPPQPHAHGAFRAACARIGREGRTPGPVMTRPPGEVYWLTGRQAVPPSADLGAVDRLGVAYLLVDDERYANAPASPLSGFVLKHPER